jgi:hypothetical protein
MQFGGNFFSHYMTTGNVKTYAYLFIHGLLLTYVVINLLINKTNDRVATQFTVQKFHRKVAYVGIHVLNFF